MSAALSDEPDEQPIALEPEPTERELELSSEVEGLRKALDDMRTERDHWRTARQPDKEAQAISACVKALEGLAPDRIGSGYGSSTGTVYWTNSGQAERVLRYLATRFGVTWYDPPAVTGGLGPARGTQQDRRHDHDRDGDGDV